MKKIAILTSVLVLAACGGGHNGGEINDAEAFMRSGFISDSAKASNGNLTSMTSGIVVAKDGSGSAVRSATKTYNGKEYAVYTLDDVKFLIAQDPTNGHFQFNIDENGRVDSVKENLGGIEGELVRIGDTARFNAPMFEYVKDGGDNAKWRVVDDGSVTIEDLTAIATAKGLTGGHWNRIDEVLDIKTFGSDLGLQFSDFGHFNPVYKTKNKQLTTDDLIASARAGTLNRGSDLDKSKTESEMENEFTNSQDYQLFAGGYAISGTQIKDTLTPTAGMNFKGTAHGRIYTSIQTKGTEGANRGDYLNAYDIAYTDPTNAGHDMAKTFVTNNATLNVNADSQVLTMPFSEQGFYDVTVTKNNVSNTSTIAFDNWGGNSRQYQIDVGGTQTPEYNVKMGYYGINTPTEAAGVVQYRTENVLAGDTETDNYATREWEFQAAYGMKLQQ